jgi:hypothetical protein
LSFVKIFATIQRRIQKKGLELPKVTPGSQGFVTKLGTQIVHMTGQLHQHIADRLIWKDVEVGIIDDELKKEISQKCKSAETEQQEIENLKLLKNLFIAKVNRLRMGNMNYVLVDTYKMQHIAFEIYKICKHDDAEKQFEFFLDLFVANLMFMEDLRKVTYAYQWNMEIEP